MHPDKGSRLSAMAQGIPGEWIGPIWMLIA